MNVEMSDPPVLVVLGSDAVGLDHDTTALVLTRPSQALPRIAWIGPMTDGLSAADVADAVGTMGAPASVHVAGGRSVAILPEVSQAWFGRPGLRGHRIGADQTGADRPAAGRDWSTAFAVRGVEADGDRIRVEAEDPAARLGLLTEIEAVPGGALRIRHTLTNLAAAPFVVDGLEVVVPIADRAAEVLDMTGRWGRERVPQRHQLVDGVWLREGRTGRTGPESATMMITGTAGFGFRRGEVWGTHVAWSGNSLYTVERQPTGLVTMGGGELLLPGEVVLGDGESYATPWVFVAASAQGLDGLAAQFHDYLRALPAHARLPRPVVGNVWEAVYFGHEPTRLKALADLAADVGIERFVLDDGWFGARRDDRAGLGDWVVSTDVWPDGLGPLIEHVEKLGMQFGLWFEPEMVNADSELFRAHQDWILSTGGRVPIEFRNQLVLDLGRPEVREYLCSQMDAVLSANAIRYVKWDHNRGLVDAGSAAREGAAGVHDTTAGFYLLLDELRRRHPDVEWESCASGGGRVDLGVLERAERIWTSDMTDALARQVIQRWTGQLVAPEYLGAHVSAEENHQTGRRLPLDFRAATAFFGDLGVEWDLSAAGEADRRRLAAWIGLYKQHRQLLHSGRVVRLDSPVPEQWIYGVVAADRSQAIFAHVQLDETVCDPIAFIVDGLDPSRSYTARQVVPTIPDPHEGAPHGWRGEGMRLSGAVLQAVGLPAPARIPISAHLVHLQAD